jgi:hypothetical protein
MKRKTSTRRMRKGGAFTGPLPTSNNLILSLGGSRRRRMKKGGQEQMQMQQPASTGESLWSRLSSGVSSLGTKLGNGLNSVKQSAMNTYQTAPSSTMGGRHSRKRRGGQVVGFDGDWREYGPAVGGRRRKRRGGGSAEEEDMVEGAKYEDMGGRRRKRKGGDILPGWPTF